MFTISDPNSSIFIKLSANGLARVVTLMPDEDRALTVGSMARADFRVTSGGVAPVQFHLERRNSGVWLVPAYGLGDLRVNAARVAGPAPLEQRNVIEFSGVRLDATVLDTDDANADAVQMNDDTTEHRASYTLNLPDEDDATRVAMRSVSAPSSSTSDHATAVLRPLNEADLVMAQQTERMAPYRVGTALSEESPIPQQTTERMSPLRPPLAGKNERAPVTELGTEIMAPYRPNAAPQSSGLRGSAEPLAPIPAPEAPVKVSVPRTQVFEPVDLRSPAQQHERMPVPAADAWPAPESAAFGSARALGGRARTLRAAIVPARVVVLSAEPLPNGPNGLVEASGGDGNTTAFEVPAVRVASQEQVAVAPRQPQMHPFPGSDDNTLAAMARVALAPEARASWLARLGIMTKARPLVVTTAATLGSFVLAALLLVATRVIEHRAGAHPRPVPVATLAPTSIAPQVSTPAPSMAASIQIVEAALGAAPSSATRATPPSVSKKAPADPELAAAVAALIAGRFGEARAAYVALSRRPESPIAYSSISDLLARAAEPECSGSAQPSSEKCPGVHR